MRGVCLIFLFVLYGCGASDPCRPTPDVELSKVSIEVERLEQQLFQSTSKEQVKELLANNPIMSTQLLHADQYPNLDILSNRMFDMVNDPFIDTLYEESVAAFDQETFEKEMNEALAWLKYYVPITKTPRVQTVVTGLYNDLVVLPEHIVIGIDFFIGPNASYQPTEIPNYILRRYTNGHLVPTIMEFLVGNFAATGVESTLLSEMIDYGKIYYVLGKIMPCKPDDLIMGYTAQEAVDAFAYQELIWARIIEQEVLYATDDFTKKKFVGERPKTFELGDECPGRIGAWLGWQIVKAYMDKTNSTIPELLANRQHHEIFALSEYKPRNIR